MCERAGGAHRARHGAREHAGTQVAPGTSAQVGAQSRALLVCQLHGAADVAASERGARAVHPVVEQ